MFRCMIAEKCMIFATTNGEKNNNNNTPNQKMTKKTIILSSPQGNIVLYDRESKNTRVDD